MTAYVMQLEQLLYQSIQIEMETTEVFTVKAKVAEKSLAKTILTCFIYTIPYRGTMKGMLILY